MPSLAICGVLGLYSPVCIRLGRVYNGSTIRTTQSGKAQKEDGAEQAEVDLHSKSVF